MITDGSQIVPCLTFPTSYKGWILLFTSNDQLESVVIIKFNIPLEDIFSLYQVSLFSVKNVTVKEEIHLESVSFSVTFHFVQELDQELDRTPKNFHYFAWPQTL